MLESQLKLGNSAQSPTNSPSEDAGGMPGDSFDAVPDTISVGNGPDADAATTVPPPDANGDSGGSADGRDSGDSGTLYAVAAASDKKLRVMPVNVAAGTLGAQMEVPSERDRQTVT